jgi:hypothetical protein
MKTEVICSSETSVLTRTTRRLHIPEVTDVNALQLQKTAYYKVPDKSMLGIMALLMTVGNLWEL